MGAFMFLMFLSIVGIIMGVLNENAVLVNGAGYTFIGLSIILATVGIKNGLDGIHDLLERKLK